MATPLVSRSGHDNDNIVADRLPTLPQMTLNELLGQREQLRKATGRAMGETNARRLLNKIAGIDRELYSRIESAMRNPHDRRDLIEILGPRQSLSTGRGA